MPAVFRPVHHGVIESVIVADITGYDRERDGAELDHSRAVFAELLGVLSARLASALGPSLTDEARAVWRVGRLPPDVVQRLDDAFLAFHRRLRDIATGSTCRCRACADAPRLALRFVVDESAEGDESRRSDLDWQRSPELPARDVVVATSAALRRLGPTHKRDFRPVDPHADPAADALSLRDLHELRRRAWNVELPVRPVDAHLRVVERFGLSPGDLWDAAAAALPMGIADLTFPVIDEIKITRFERRASPSGAAAGTEWHCYHGAQGERVTFLRIVAHDRTRLVTVHAGGADRYYATARLVPSDGGTTVDVSFEWEDGADRAVVARYRAAVARQLAKLRDRASASAGGTGARRTAPLDALPDAPPSDRSALTPREREVAALVARGSTNRAIAEALVISERTVETHIEHIMDKLRVRARSEIAVWAVTSGLVSVSTRAQG